MPAPSRIVYAPKKRETAKPRWNMPRRTFGILGVLGVLTLLVVGIVYLLNAPYVRVVNVRIDGTVYLSSEAIENAVRGELAGARWLVVPRDNFFFLSSERIREYLQREFPEAAKITVTKDFPKGIRIQIHERVLWGVYCQNRPLPESPSPCFYLDEHGVAFQEFSGIQGWLLPKIVGPASLTVGTSAVSEDLFLLFETSARTLQAIDANLLEIHESTSTPSDVALVTDEGWEIRIPRARSVAEWFAILKTVLEKEISDKRSELQYVDLRFGQKVFYKYR